MVPREKQKYPTRKYRSKVTLTTTTGTKHVVELVGVETAVKELAGLIALGVQCRALGITPERIQAGTRMAMEQLGHTLKEH